MRVCNKRNRPAPLQFNGLHDLKKGPISCPNYFNPSLSPNTHNNVFKFDTDPFQSVPSSPWSPMPTPSLTDLWQALQTLTLTICQQNAAPPCQLPETPQRLTTKMPEVSRKVFVGGLPTSIEKSIVEKVFGKFGAVVVDWPRSSNPDEKASIHSNGYVFLIYEQMESVQNLILHCQLIDNRFFYSFGYGNAQVRPWYIKDCVYTNDPNATVDIRNTVFLGGVPRPATAEQLAKLLSCFGDVLFASIDVDPDVYYPKGAARVIFAEPKSFIKAIKKRFIKMDMLECHKKEIEMKPYVVENQLCDQCEMQTSNLFCIDQQCLQYYCGMCFDHLHQEPHKSNHRVVIREGERTMDVQGAHNLHLSRSLDHYIGQDVNNNPLNYGRL